MSTTSSAASNPDNPGGHLPTTTTFLPILDDLLSPDFRPVTYPPVVTPLQTPTTTGLGVHNGGGAAGDNVGNSSSSSYSNNKKVVVLLHEDKDEAAEKIQKWWKSKSCGKLEEENDQGHERSDLETERARVALRHRRAEEHIRALESEVNRLKSSLATERKLRSLQYEAIRSLWSQVQKLTVNNPGCVELQQQVHQQQVPAAGVGGAASAMTMMTQSLPNGLPNESNPTQPPSSDVASTGAHCNCATEFTTVVRKLEDEIADLRALIVQNFGGVGGKEDDRAGSNTMESSTTSSGSTKVNKRPDSLDLNGGSGSNCSRNAATAKPEEIQGYANEMAKFVVERGISDNLDQSCVSGGNGGEGGE